MNDQFYCLDEGLAEIEYQLGLRFCVLDDNISAFYWLKCAAFKNHEKAIALIHEMIKKKLI